MVIKKLSSKHYLCKGIKNDRGSIYCRNPSNRLLPGAREFWKQCDLDACPGAYAAFANGKIIGFVRYDDTVDSIYACGTWVAEEYRNKGIAKLLWDKLLKLSKRNKHAGIKVSVCSNGGKALVNSIKQRSEFPIKMEYCSWFAGERQ